MAIDLGTTAGWALALKGSDAALSGVWSFARGKFDGAGMRFVKFRKKLQDLHDIFGIEAVYFEGVRAHKGVDAAHAYGGFMAVLQAFCEENAIPYDGVSVQDIKKYATNRGNADKDAMVAAVRGWGYDPATSDEADAIAILRLVLEKRE